MPTSPTQSTVCTPAVIPPPPPNHAPISIGNEEKICFVEVLGWWEGQKVKADGVANDSKLQAWSSYLSIPLECGGQAGFGSWPEPLHCMQIFLLTDML